MSPEELSLLKDAVCLFEKPKDNLVRKALAHIDAQSQQIEALKDGWKEDRAAKIFYEIYPGVSDYYSWKGYPEDPCQMRPKRSIREEASRQLAAEHPDLFGPEDITAKPAKIVLTEEQRVALGLVCDLADEYECKYASTADEQSKAIGTVRALLQEARL